MKYLKAITELFKAFEGWLHWVFIVLLLLFSVSDHFSNTAMNEWMFKAIGADAWTQQ